MSLIVSLWMLMTALGAQLIGEPSENKLSDLTINIVTLAGRSTYRGTLTIRNEKGMAVYADEAKDKLEIRVPYGSYTVTFKLHLKQTVRQININEPRVFVLLGVPDEDVIFGHPTTPTSITVAIRPSTSCTSNGELWAKLVAVFSGYSVEKKVDGPYALFESVEHGTYLVIILDGEKIRTVQPVATLGKLTSVKLELSSCK